MASGGVLVGHGYVSIRPEFDGDWSHSIGTQASKAGADFGSIFGKVLTKSLAVPLASVGASVGAAMAASFASAGAAAGAFKLAVQPQLESVTKASDAYTKVQDKQAEAQQKTAAAAKLAAKGGKEYEQALSDAQAASKAAKDAQDAYKLSLSDMPPATQTTAKAFISLKSETKAWSDSLSGTTMPIFTQGINLLRGVVPKLTPLVKSAAGAFKGFLDNLDDARTKKVFGEFSANIKGLAGPSLSGFLTAAKNIAVGFVGILNAFAPMSKGVTTGLVGLTERFAEFGASLRESSGFQKFMEYVRENMPVVFNLLGNLATTIGHVVVALAPLGGSTLLLVDAFASLVAIIPTKVLAVLATAMAGLAVGLKAYALTVLVVEKATAAWAFIQGVLNGTIALNPIGILIGTLVALGVALFLAYKKSDTFRAIVQAAFQGIKDVAVSVFNWFKGPFVQFFTTTIPAAFGVVVSWVKRNWPWILGALTGPIGLAAVAIIKYWGNIKSGISSAWSWIKSNVLYPVRDFFTKTVPGWASTLKSKVVGAFDAARAGIKTAWDKIRAITKAPVQFVVDTVYNNGIRKVWNLVTDAFGGKHLDVMKFASGGILPGYTPGRDVHTFYSPTAGLLGLSGGEAIMRPEFTRAVGASGVEALNAAARSGGVSGVRGALGFKDGGIFGGIGDALSGAWDKVKSAASWLKDTFSGALKTGASKVISPLINKIPGGGGFAGLLKSLMKGAVEALVGAGKKGDGLITPHVNYSPSAGVEQWRPVVLQALREVGQSASLANTTLRRMQQESGGNPTIVNRWDSNWQAGHPSVGLMQVIGPTFRSYAGKYRNKGPFSYGVSVDPLANVYSSMRYALGAYGSLSKAYDRAGGYDAGGWLQPGVTKAVNLTGKPEAVLTSAQWQVMASAANGAGLDGMQVNVYVGNEQIRDITRAEVRDSQQKLIAVLNAS